MYIRETRSVRHKIESDVLEDMLSHIIEEVKGAWWSGTIDGSGNVEIEYDKYSVTVTVKSGGMAVSRVKYTLVKDAEDYEKEGVMK